jgi:hypothetical protein
MTKLEELKAAQEAARDAARGAWDAARDAWHAYKAELEKQEETRDD